MGSRAQRPLSYLSTPAPRRVNLGMEEPAIARKRAREEQSAVRRRVTGSVHLGALPRVSLAFVEPMLTDLVAQLPSGPGWAYEVKYDGYRAIAVKAASGARLLSRNGSDLRGRFPSVAAALAALPAGTLLNGEVVALDPA